jgi:hypothetical protein
MTGKARILAALLLVLVGVTPVYIQAVAGDPFVTNGICAVRAKVCPADAGERASIGGDQAGRTKKPQGSPAKTEKPSPKEDSGPIAVFASIESSWKAQNVKQILAHFGKGKVAISIPGAGPSGGRFSKSQSYYLLKDLFKYTITKKFEFIQYRNMNSGKKRVFAVAERYYKRTDDGRLFKDKIYVSLQIEGDHWVVDEIKSIQ